MDEGRRGCGNITTAALAIGNKVIATEIMKEIRK